MKEESQEALLRQPESEGWMKRRKLLYLSVQDIFLMQIADFRIILEK